MFANESKLSIGIAVIIWVVNLLFIVYLFYIWGEFGWFSNQMILLISLWNLFIFILLAGLDFAAKKKPEKVDWLGFYSNLFKVAVLMGLMFGAVLFLTAWMIIYLNKS